MTIKRQFHLLIGGIILLPLLTTIGFVIVDRLHRDEAQLALPLYEDIAELLPADLNRFKWNSITKHLSYIRPGTDIVILRRDLMVLFSTLNDFETGKYINNTKLLELMQDTRNPSERYIFEIPPWRHGKQFFVLQKMSARPPRPFLFDRFVIMSLILCMLIFVISMSVLILRSITRSVLTLEKATARVANGDLDVAVEAKGSNEISSLVNSLNKLRLDLQEEELRRSRFIMGVTHDLKTPLALIKGYAEAIEDGYATDPSILQHYTGIITDKVAQLEGMVNGLLEFVRLDSGEDFLELHELKLRLFIEAFVTRMSNDAQLLQRTVTAKLDIDEKLSISLDERLATRALENIVNNALRYTKPGGQVLVWVHLVGTNVIIEISDDGPGIKPEDIKHVFDMFYRGSGSRREEGMGLGLAVVKSIAELHGWQVEAVPQTKGACFRVLIRLAP